MRLSTLLTCLLAASIASGGSDAGAQKKKTARAPKKPAATVAGGVKWTDVRKRIDAHWKATYPSERVISVEPKGKVEYSSTERVTESDWWWSEVKEIQGAFARQPALVTVERANRSRARFEIAALYRGTGKTYLFDKIAVGPVAELSAPSVAGVPGAPASAGAGAMPSEKVASDLFLEAWRKIRPEFTVHSVVIHGTPTPNQSGDRRWISYRIGVNVSGTDKAPKEFMARHARCEPADFASVLRWEPGRGAWVPDSSAIANVNESGACRMTK